MANSVEPFPSVGLSSVFVQEESVKDQRFDAITRQMATKLTRRWAAKTVLAGMVVGTLTPLSTRSSVAQRDRRDIADCCIQRCRAARERGNAIGDCHRGCNTFPSDFNCN
jgi:uncharacterized protein YejL (UPF0352 family)